MAAVAPATQEEVQQIRVGAELDWNAILEALMFDAEKASCDECCPKVETLKPLLELATDPEALAEALKDAEAEAEKRRETTIKETLKMLWTREINCAEGGEDCKKALISLQFLLNMAKTHKYRDADPDACASLIKEAEREKREAEQYAELLKLLEEMRRKKYALSVFSHARRIVLRAGGLL